METPALAETLLQVATDSGSVLSSPDDAAVSSSMQNVDCTAQVFAELTLEHPCFAQKMPSTEKPLGSPQLMTSKEKAICSDEIEVVSHNVYV